MTDPNTAPVAQGQRWNSGSEFLPFHPQASHVSPDYRNGWNDCYEIAQQRIAELEARLSPDTAPDTSQDWALHGGAVAFHLIERHADDWSDTGRMMEAWDKARFGAHDSNVIAKPAPAGIVGVAQDSDVIAKPHAFCPDCGKRNAPGLIHTCSPVDAVRRADEGENA